MTSAVGEFVKKLADTAGNSEGIYAWYSGGFSGKEPLVNAETSETGFKPLGLEDPLRRV